MYQVTPVHLVTQESYAWFKLAKERPVKSLNLKRLFIVIPPPQMVPSRKRLCPFSFGAWGLSVNVRLPATVLKGSFSAFLFPVFTDF